jgi:hypothetical protein
MRAVGIHDDRLCPFEVAAACSCSPSQPLLHAKGSNFCCPSNMCMHGILMWHCWAVMQGEPEEAASDAGGPRSAVEAVDTTFHAPARA